MSSSDITLPSTREVIVFGFATNDIGAPAPAQTPVKILTSAPVISSAKTAGFLLSLYFVGMMIGRFLGSFLMTWIKAEKLLAVLGFLGVALLLISMFTTGPIAIWSLVLCGFANSIMYPNIFALGIAELGPMTSKGSGVITIGNVGGAIIPPLFGFLADKIGIQYAFILPIIGYLFVAYYGISGYKPTRIAKA